MLLSGFPLCSSPPPPRFLCREAPGIPGSHYGSDDDDAAAAAAAAHISASPASWTAAGSPLSRSGSHHRRASGGDALTYSGEQQAERSATSFPQAGSRR